MRIYATRSCRMSACGFPATWHDPFGRVVRIAEDERCDFAWQQLANCAKSGVWAFEPEQTRLSWLCEFRVQQHVQVTSDCLAASVPVPCEDLRRHPKLALLPREHWSFPSKEPSVAMVGLFLVNGFWRLARCIKVQALMISVGEVTVAAGSIMVHFQHQVELSLEICCSRKHYAVMEVWQCCVHHQRPPSLLRLQPKQSPKLQNETALVYMQVLPVFPVQLKNFEDSKTWRLTEMQCINWVNFEHEVIQSDSNVHTCSACAACMHALHAQSLQYKLIRVQEQHRPRSSSGGVFAPRTTLGVGIGDGRGHWINSELDKIFMSPFKLSDLLLRPSEMVASLNLRSLHSSVRNWEVA